MIVMIVTALLMWWSLVGASLVTASPCCLPLAGSGPGVSGLATGPQEAAQCWVASGGTRGTPARARVTPSWRPSGTGLLCLSLSLTLSLCSLMTWLVTSDCLAPLSSPHPLSPGPDVGEVLSLSVKTVWTVDTTAAQTKPKFGFQTARHPQYFVVQ